MLEQEGFSIEEDAKEHLKKYLEFIYDYRDKYFGNARTVRNVINEITKNQSLRLAAMPNEERNPMMLNVITYEDTATLKLSNDEDIFNKKSIGFRKKTGAGN
jgi:hypothetical protein